MDFQDKTGDRLMRLAHVREMTALSRSTLYAKMAEGSFPKPVSLGNRSVAWVEAEVRNWIATRIESRKT